MFSLELSKGKVEGRGGASNCTKLTLREVGDGIGYHEGEERGKRK